jgi:small-conductance mechanosensitive channel
VYNHSDHNIAARVDVRVSYDSDLRLTKQIIQEEAQKSAEVEQDTIEVFLLKTDEQGVTFSLIYRLEGSPFDSVSRLKEKIVLRLLSENVTLK